MTILYSFVFEQSRAIDHVNDSIFCQNAICHGIIPLCRAGQHFIGQTRLPLHHVFDCTHIYWTRWPQSQFRVVQAYKSRKIFFTDLWIIQLKMSEFLSNSKWDWKIFIYSFSEQTQQVFPEFSAGSNGKASDFFYLWFDVNFIIIWKKIVRYHVCPVSVWLFLRQTDTNL